MTSAATERGPANQGPATNRSDLESAGARASRFTGRVTQVRLFCSYTASMLRPRQPKSSPCAHATVRAAGFTPLICRASGRRSGPIEFIAPAS